MFDLIAGRHVMTDLTASSRFEAITFIHGYATRAGVIPEKHAHALLLEVFDREGRASTGVGLGIAMPHTRSYLVERESAVLAVAPNGIPGWSESGAIVVLRYTPAEPPELSLSSQVRIVTALKEADVRAGLLRARTREEALAILRRFTARSGR